MILLLQRAVSNRLWTCTLDVGCIGNVPLSFFLSIADDVYVRSDQLVTLTATQTPTPVRIVGITLDHGLLRTMPERGLSNPYFSSSVGKVEEEYIDLQPDGNSFDLMSGMIKTKR